MSRHKDIPIDAHRGPMSNPIAVAIGELQASLLRGDVPSIVIDTDAIEPMDDDDKRALRAFFDEED